MKEGKHFREERRRRRPSAKLISRWLATNRDVVLSYLRFLSVTIVGFGLVVADWSSGYFLDPLNLWTAQASGALINAFGGEVVVNGVSLSSAQGNVTIREGCNAVYVTILFVAGVVAFPTTWRKRIVGAICGTVILFAINLIRVITLFYLSGYDQKLFEEAHLHIWQFVIIVLGGLVWLLWYDKVVRRPLRERGL